MGIFLYKYFNIAIVADGNQSLGEIILPVFKRDVYSDQPPYKNIMDVTLLRPQPPTPSSLVFGLKERYILQNIATNLPFLSGPTTKQKLFCGFPYRLFVIFCDVLLKTYFLLKLLMLNLSILFNFFS